MHLLPPRIEFPEKNLRRVLPLYVNGTRIFQTASSGNGLVKMEAIVDASNETIWATQKAMTATDKKIRQNTTTACVEILTD